MSTQTANKPNHIPFLKVEGVKFFRARKGEHEFLTFIFAADIEGRPMRFFDIRTLAKAVGMTLDPDVFIQMTDEQRMGVVTNLVQSASQQMEITEWLLANGWMWRPE